MKKLISLLIMVPSLVFAAGSSTTQPSANVLKAQIASTAAGKGAEMVGYKAAGAGAVDRTVAQKAGEVLSVADFGAIGDGIADDTAAVSAARVAAAGKKLFFPFGVYLVDAAAVDFSIAPPAIIDASEATIKCRTATAGPFLFISNPHATIESFKISAGMIDANGLAANALKIKGGQRMNIDARVKGATSHGVLIEADAGFGVYYSKFDFMSTDNGGDGVALVGLDSPNIRIASNTFTGQASNNLGNGWSSLLAQNTYVGAGSEVNNGFGFNVDYCLSNDFIGGYSERNHQNKAQGGISDATADESFNLTASAARVKVLGGRHIGAISGSTAGVGKLFLPSSATFDGFYLDGSLEARLPGILTVQGGLGVAGATPIANGINIAKGATYADIAVSGIITTRFNPADKSMLSRGPVFVSDTSRGVHAGEGSPEGVLTAPVGSLYLRTDGGAGTTLYVKETGTGNTGWVAK